MRATLFSVNSNKFLHIFLFFFHFCFCFHFSNLIHFPSKGRNPKHVLFIKRSFDFVCRNSTVDEWWWIIIIIIIFVGEFNGGKKVKGKKTNWSIRCRQKKQDTIFIYMYIFAIWQCESCKVNPVHTLTRFFLFSDHVQLNTIQNLWHIHKTVWISLETVKEYWHLVRIRPNEK